MAFDQFKTQVLLLHSEQSTLDSLRSGFSDRYTVHCATSGSEALNTLVETPINVIITAQKLPGMSGLEALREARKRSPDTVGILLAGSGDDGLEALVGDEEVFQIVRGSVTSDSLLKLVDNATRQMRLMALAESANDTAANPDEPAAHIVMETSANGSTIITEGTGRMPVLDPDQVSAASAVGSQSIDILVLTKDQEFLTTIRESSRGMHTVHYANTLAQADAMIREHKVGVAVVDAAMVGQKIEQLTQHLRKGSPRLVSIVAGRRDDGEMLMDLINRGKVYRFLLKPVSPGRARLAVEASVKHHLEAPDAAFKVVGTASARPAPTAKPAPKPSPKPAAKPAPAPKPEARRAAAPEAAPKPAPQRAKKPAPATAPKPAAKPESVDPPLGDVSIESPVNERLSSAFGNDDSSLTETVTSLISSVSKKFTGDDEALPSSPDSPALEIPRSSPVSSTGGSVFTNPKIIGLAAVIVIAIAGAGYWFMSDSDEGAPVAEPVATTPAPAANETDSEFDAAAQPGVDVDALVAEARLAREAGQIFNPLGSNAIELYAATVAADPSNAIHAAELDAVIQQALAIAETALLEGRLSEAEAALQRVATVDANNSRLPFLTAQMWQVQLRNHIADARTAIREKRFEDAGSAVAAAVALNLGDTAEIDAVRTELTEARSTQQADDVLAKANARMEEGNLLSPANDNARYYYDLVLSNDANNTAARQGLNAVASKLVLQARAEIDAGNFDSAETLLDSARAIDPDNSELTVAATTLGDARDAVVQREQRAAQERRRVEEADRQAAAEKAAAEKAAEERRLADEAAAAAAALAAAAATSDAAEVVVADDVGEAEQMTVDDPVVEPQAERVAQEPGVVLNQSPVSISALNRTRYVAPKYPRAAERRGLSGWVDVVFTVAMDGSVKDLKVREASPEDVFDVSALRAVERWEFEPVVENGVLVEKRAGVRMMFALE
ncbi:MAG: TonB family protein [Gammaproteobacteria bacterium]|nr:TonB family protein [Gammaproteobacteria bacterium]